MNEVSHIGFSQIQELYEQHVKEIDDTLLHSKKAKCSTGMPGEPLPYQLRTDLPITCVVFLCFFLIIYALKNGKKYLHQHLKGFFRHLSLIRNIQFRHPLSPHIREYQLYIGQPVHL